MSSQTKDLIKSLIEETLVKKDPALQQLFPAEVEIPNDKAHGDFSSNIALKSAKILRKPPLVIAQDFQKLLEEALPGSPLRTTIQDIEVKNPGFINFRLSAEALKEILRQILADKEEFGKSTMGLGRKVLLEFVSANPTGPLSVAHARQAAVGDALGNILHCLGFAVQKEFYVNDEGNQINLLGASIACRARELLGVVTPIPENGYQGEYIRDMARDFLQLHRIENLEQFEKTPAQEFSRYGVDTLMGIIKKELSDFNVHFDQWSYQSQVASDAIVAQVLDGLEQKTFLFHQDGALWFRSTGFGDDKDRVVRKSNGSYTYLAPDIAYHKNKFERGFEELVNIWGPDHHGYIPRLKAAVAALGHAPDALQVLIVQLATIYREGQPVSMSTRRGQYISLREVMEEVGVDAARYFFLMRHINIHLDFDLELAKKESPENPVYYIQYAHARIHSIWKKADEGGLKSQQSDFELLKEPEETDLIRTLGSFPAILHLCRQQMDPFPLVTYLLEVATGFHKFYDRHRVIDPQDNALSSQRLSLIEATRIVLANGLRLAGVHAPERM